MLRYGTPILIGITMISQEAIQWVLEFTSLARNMLQGKSHIALGGYFSSLQYDKVFRLIPDVDSVVLGEGEFTIVELVSSLESGEDWHLIDGIAYRQSDKVVVNPRRKLLHDLDRLPYPKRYLAYNMTEDFEVLIEGSRGCVFCCSFCAIKPFFKLSDTTTWRSRSPINIINEMVRLREKNPKLTKFRFVDPDFIGPEGRGEERAFHLAQMIQENLPRIELYIEGRAISIKKNETLLQELKKAGLKDIYIGIESGNQHILDKMLKQTKVDDIKDAIKLLRKLKIDFTYGFMMFTPWTTESDILENIQFIKEIGNVQMDKFFHAMDLIPCTVALKQAQKVSQISEDRNTGYYTYSNKSHVVKLLREIGKVLETQHLSFMEDLWYLYKDVQRASQMNVKNASELEMLTNELFLSMFRFCFQEAKTSSTDCHNHVDMIAMACINKFRLQYDTIVSQLNSNVRFPRISNPTD
jgi:radical SAM superfamily enzyme YgiQ (UPF0313 family)